MRGQAKTTTWPGGVAGQQVRLSHILLQPEGEGGRQRTHWSAQSSGSSSLGT